VRHTPSALVDCATDSNPRPDGPEDASATENFAS
jgi:hypothetical protein